MDGATDDLDRQPLLVAIVGPGGVARSTFFRDFTRSNRLPFVNANLIAEAHKAGAHEANRVAEELRDDLIARAQSFVLVTELSDPAGRAVEFLRRMSVDGYRVAVCFIGLNCSEQCDGGSAAGRTNRGGYEMSTDELLGGYPHTLDNLAQVLRTLPCVLVYDNTYPAQQIRLVAEYRTGISERVGEDVPAWFDAFIERLRLP